MAEKEVGRLSHWQAGYLIFSEFAISATPSKFNYLLAFDGELESNQQSFIPLNAIKIATDKRETAQIFNNEHIPSPTTYLLDDTGSHLKDFLANRSSQTWLLKWPIGCGAAGHRFIQSGDHVPDDWPLPLVIQEFIPQKRPEVFRFYCVAGELFGFNARRFADENDSPFVAHARGAHYEMEIAPLDAEVVARLALKATHLWDSFGCVDLLRSQNGEWLGLEVNTDRLWMHVDRDVPDSIGAEIEERLAVAFRNFISSN